MVLCLRYRKDLDILDSMKFMHNVSVVIFLVEEGCHDRTKGCLNQVEEKGTSHFQFEEEYSTIDLVEEPLIYVRRTSGH